MPSRWSATCPPGGDLGKKSGVRGMKCPQNWGSTGCGAEVIQKKAWHSYFLLSILPSVFFEMQVPEMKLSTMWWDSWYFHPVGHMVWFFQVQFVSAPGFPILYEEDWHWNDTDLNSKESAKLIEKLIPRFDKKITFPTLFVVLEAVSTSVNIPKNVNIMVGHLDRIFSLENQLFSVWSFEAPNAPGSMWPIIQAVNGLKWPGWRWCDSNHWIFHVEEKLPSLKLTALALKINGWKIKFCLGLNFQWLC